MPDETFKKLAEISQFLTKIRLKALYGVSINEIALEIERNTPWASYAKRWPVLTGM
ncbi:hypothetical protein JK217_02215 [Gluconobacter kondonii]|uniref:hypothetical protein n=1 Tax=Gluconobacter kondonii TaxID=941463 RepID=UPI001B8B72CE|nr:hypothetical protein [Gluconobacter kondonii]MBS1076570.1 hypothetical protein [Gluconobacter kondonii]